MPPPFYQASTGSGVPMVTCRVCQAMIDISGKRDQHVVKCCQCNEATVGSNLSYGNKALSFYDCSRLGMPPQERSMWDALATAYSSAKALPKELLVLGQIVNVLSI